MSNIIPIRQRSVAPDPKSLQFKIEAYQSVIREFSPHCTPHEFAVLMQILDRTIGWGVREASFTTDALRKGDQIYGGVKIGRTALFEALASLEGKGVILRRADARFPDKRHYSVNINWRAGSGSSTRSARPSAKRTTPSGSRTPPSASRTLYTGSPDTDNLDTGNPGGPVGHAAINIRGKLSEGEQVPPRARAAPVENAEQRGTTNMIETVWRTALVETFPDHPAPTWTVREKGQANQAAKKWHQPGITFPDFIEWAARNWTAIMAKQFKWMTKSPPPRVPSTRFLFNFIGQFIECYAEDKLTSWQNSKDRSEIEDAMARGQTYEQAVAIVERQHAARSLREEMEQREAEVTRKELAARQNVERAKRIADYCAAPVHPQSIEGLRRRPRRAPDVPLDDVPDLAPPIPLDADRLDR